MLLGLPSLLLLMAPDAGWAQRRTRAENAPSRVLGVQLDMTPGARERVLIFAEDELERTVDVPTPGTLRVRLAGSVLDDSVPRLVEPQVEGAIRAVRALERVVEGVQVVDIEITHVEGLNAQVSNREAIVAVEFPAYVRPKDQAFALNFVEEKLSVVVDELARQTGERFLYDDRLRGEVTLIGPNRVSPDEALALLDAALFMRGFAAVRGPEEFRKIIPIAEALTLAPWNPNAPSADREAPITTLVRLERANLDEVIRTLAPAVGATGLAIPLYESRSVLLAGNEAQLHRWVGLAQALDRADTDEVRVLRLRHRPAGEVAPLLIELTKERVDAPGAISILVDERSNALIVRASPSRYDDIRRWVGLLDQTLVGSGEMQVIRLRHSDPEEIADHLRALAGGATSGAGLEENNELAGLIVGVHVPTNSIIVRTSPEGQDLVREVVAALDLRPPQVAVEVTVMEIRVGNNRELALNYAVTVGDPDQGAGDILFGTISNIPEGGFPDIEASPTIEPEFAGRVRESVLIPVTLNGQTQQVLFPLHQALITASAGDVETRILMRPQFVATNGEEQEFFVGDVIPIPVASESSIEGSLLLQTDIQREDVGLELRVKPSIGQEGGVHLNLELDITDVDPTVSADRGVSLLLRRVQTDAFLRSGEFALIGFSSRGVDTEQDKRVPFLGDIPVLGWLFGDIEKVDHQRSYFLVAAQATILRDAEEQLAASMRARIAFERSLAQVGDLRGADEVRYAVLVATRTAADEATAVAGRLSLEDGEETAINGWEWEGRNRFDVMVTGYRSLAEAGRALNRLAKSGYRPRVIAIPAESDDEGQRP